MGLTGAAVGFNNALQQALAERYAQQQAQQQYADKMRQQAFENAVKLREMDFNDQLRRDQFGATQQQHDATEAQHFADTVPAGAEIQANDPGVAIAKRGGYGALVPDKGVTPEAPPASIAAPDAPTGALPGTIANSPFPNGRLVTKLPSAKQIDTQTDNERQAKAESDRAAAEQARIGREAARDKATADYREAMLHKPQTGATVVVQGPDGAMLVDKGAGTAKPVTGPDGNPLGRQPSAQERNRSTMAKSIQNRFEDVSRLVDEADKAGVLGPLAGRTMGDLLAGKIGSTGNDATDSLITELRMNMAALSSGFASLHGRGGANAGIGREIESKLYQAKMSPAEIRGSLKALKAWVDDYAGGEKAPTASGAKPTAEDLIKKYGG